MKNIIDIVNKTIKENEEKYDLPLNEETNPSLLHFIEYEPIGESEWSNIEDDKTLIESLLEVEQPQQNQQIQQQQPEQENNEEHEQPEEQQEEVPEENTEDTEQPQEDEKLQASQSAVTNNPNIEDTLALNKAIVYINFKKGLLELKKIIDTLNVLSTSDKNILKIKNDANVQYKSMLDQSKMIDHYDVNELNKINDAIWRFIDSTKEKIL